MPAHNAAAFFRYSLDSLLAQTYTNLEILIADDGSTDETLAICEEYERKDSRIRVLRLPHRGVAAARNAALEVFTGDYLMFADADDLTDCHYVSFLVSALEKAGLPIAFCSAFNCTDSRTVYSDGLTGEEPQKILKVPSEKFDYLEDDSHRVVWGAVYTREIVTGLRFSEEYAVSTDTLFFAQALVRCPAAAFIREKLYCYIQREKSVSNRPYDRKRLDDILVWEEIERLCRDTGRVPHRPVETMVLWKAMSFLKHMVLENNPDKALKKELISRVRFRYRDLLYRVHSVKGMVFDLFFITAPELYLYLLARKNRQ